jgi:predicted alpha/beta hydrolase family esterase
MSEGAFKPEVTLEQQKSLKDHDFYVFHGNFQFEMPAWVKQFGESLAQMGVPKDQIHTPRFKNLFADYKSWRVESVLPNNPEGSEKAILIGHSSGAEMAMIYAEHHKVSGLILFAPYDTSNTGVAMGRIISPLEKMSGMFTKSNPEKPGILNRIDRDFKWESIVKNCDFIKIIHSTGDNLVSEASSKNVYDKLNEASKGTDISYLSVDSKIHDPEVSQLTQTISKTEI